MLMHLYSNTINRFKTSLEQSLNEGQEYLAAIHLCSQSCMLEFDQGCEDAAIQQSECNASKFREKLICYMLSEMMAEYKKQITHALIRRVEYLLEGSEIDTKLQHLREHARNLLEMKAREAADPGRVLMRMKDRYITSL
ncbi:PROTEIN SEY1 [Salix purpurea]|uniref:PROTEIN SEY1 n=1 Tax=Salix purpurea TaxID=77065 RepID=A0A9Q0VGC9_SALPP|nr:PROTEIN SEY1 [Salix purpurea]